MYSKERHPVVEENHNSGKRGTRPLPSDYDAYTQKVCANQDPTAFTLSLEVFQLEVASLNLEDYSGDFDYSRHSTAHLSWWLRSGSSSFRRAISVCMNLLYAVSFLRPPPPEDLANKQVSQVRRFLRERERTLPLRLFACCLLFFGHGSGPLWDGR